MRRTFALLTVAVVLPAAVPGAADAAAPSRLPRFASCTDLVGFARANLDRPVVQPLVGGGAIALSPRAPLTEPAPATPGDAVAARPVTAQPESTAGEEYSTTNVQEAGIDEPDLVKTDGRRMFVVAGATLRAYDVTGDVPVALGSLDLGGAGGELLVRGGRALLIGPAPQGTPPDPGAGADAASVAIPAGGQTRLMEIDLRDPSKMTIARTMTVPGDHVSSRLTGATARVVMSSPATVAPGDETPSVSDFVPRTTLRSRITQRTFRRALVSCRGVRHPRAYAGNDLLTVLSVNLDRGLFDVDRDAVLAGAQVVYASERALYVASRRSVRVTEGNVPEDLRTEIHRFDTTAPGETAYSGSGSVTGFVLNQYALSEHDGRLRVASTEEPQWVADAPATRPSESAVTVLRASGGRLEQVGRVGGLGRDERIYAARFIGDVGYLVTFRQVDPLYTLDLRDPTRPRVAGELKITGYSAYLHPIGEDLLLGVGQDATTTGARLGAQVSVFDVANPARPARLHQHPLGTGRSQVEDDPHAFLWWPKAKLALVPYEDWSASTADHGMVGLRVGRAEGLTEAGRITHGPAWDRAAVQRSVIVGDRVLTVSDFGVASNRLDALAPLGFLPFVTG